MAQPHRKIRLNSVWIPALFIAAALLFFAILYKTSPYRALYPYTLRSAEQLIVSDHKKSASGSHWLICVPADDAQDFWIDQIPVTIADYQQCVSQGQCSPPHYRGYFAQIFLSSLYRRYPVTYVPWEMAQQYCEHVGGSLPSEAQWKTAAGAASGNRYPWGADEPDLAKANFDGFYQGLIPAGWLPAGVSPYGVLDLAGNVREWVLDVYTESDVEVSKGDIERILKGGSSSDFPDVLEIDAVQWHSQFSAGFNRGFRCVYPVD